MNRGARGLASGGCAAAVVAALVLAPGVAFAAEAGGSASADDDAVEWTLLPGSSRALSPALSASRDTALMGYQVTPRVVLTCGADFAFVGARFAGLELRAGMFGIIEVSSTTFQPASFMNVPAAPHVWRGLLGYSLALSLEEVARRWLGPRGGLEVAVVYRHESAHWTGMRSTTGPEYLDVPYLGDFVMPEGAARVPIGPVDLDLRVQYKAFLPVGRSQAYRVGPGAEAIARARIHDALHPFVSVFGERVIGRTLDWYGERRRIPDLYLARGLVGVVVVGREAEMQVFFSAAAGHDKGLLAFENERRIGWGIRVNLFENAPPGAAR